MMKNLKGIGASKGIAYGKLLYLENRKKVEKYESQYDLEKRRLDGALSMSVSQLESLLNSSKSYLNDFELGIFEVQIQLLQDENIISSIDDKIKSHGCNAEYAVELSLNEITNRLKNLNDETVLSRIADVKDVFARVIANLNADDNTNLSKINGTVIIAAKELLPSTALNLDLSKVGGIISKKGSEKGHLAIIARALNIPYVCGIEEDCNLFDKLLDNTLDDTDLSDAIKTAIVDGFKGEIILNPDNKTREIYINEMARIFNENAIYSELKGLDNATKDGRKIDILCNINLVDEIDSVFENDGAGVGLLRSEFLFMQEKEFPSEEKQYHYYSHIIKKMANKKTVIRTIDIGEDKIPSYMQKNTEGDDALIANHGISFCLENPEIFKTQLRAIYRASANVSGENGEVAVLFPMVKTPDELKQCIEFCDEVQKELKNSQIPFNENVKKGIMIECVQAVNNAEEFAKVSDFFSVGTNDLLRELTTQNHFIIDASEDERTVILNMIKKVSDVAHSNNIKVGICGELASDISITEEFLKMGIDELSVTPLDVLKLRYRIRSL